MKRGWWWAGASAVVILLAGGLWWWRADGGGAVPASPAPVVWTALPHVVTVEVLNATDISGLARVGTIELRAAGLDVTYYGTAESRLRTDGVTRVLIRGADTTGVGRIREAMGDIRVENAPSTARFVDLTVVLGDDYHGIRRKP